MFCHITNDLADDYAIGRRFGAGLRLSWEPSGDAADPGASPDGSFDNPFALEPEAKMPPQLICLT